MSDVSTLTWRECKHVEAFKKRAEGDTLAAISAWEEILLHYPTGNVKLLIVLMKSRSVFGL